MTGLESLKARMSPLPEGRLLIGLSGGADSVALLLTALLDPDRNGTNLCAVHVNHGLRGGNRVFMAHRVEQNRRQRDCLFR